MRFRKAAVSGRQTESLRFPAHHIALSRKGSCAMSRHIACPLVRSALRARPASSSSALRPSSSLSSSLRILAAQPSQSLRTTSRSLATSSRRRAEAVGGASSTGARAVRPEDAEWQLPEHPARFSNAQTPATPKCSSFSPRASSAWQMRTSRARNRPTSAASRSRRRQVGVIWGV